MTIVPMHEEIARRNKKKNNADSPRSELGTSNTVLDLQVSQHVGRLWGQSSK